jgi:hypothetical protein
MLYAAPHAGFQQVTRVGCVVFVVQQWIFDGVGDDGRAREMQDRVYVAVGEDPLDQRLVGDVALEEMRGFGDQRSNSRREVIEHANGLTLF